MTLKRSVLKPIYWCWMLTILIPNITFAQKRDSVSYKEDQVYYYAGMELGAGFGKINHLAETNPDDRSGSTYFNFAVTLVINRVFIQGKASSYFFILADPPIHFDTYSVLFGRDLPVGEKNFFSVATGASRFDNYFAGKDRDVNTSLISHQHITGFGLPIEVKYTLTDSKVAGFTITYGVNINADQFVSNISIGFILGKLREKNRNEEHHLF